MLDDMLKSLLLRVLVGGLLIITLTYVVSSTVMLGIDAHTTAASIDRYDSYVVANTK